MDEANNVQSDSDPLQTNPLPAVPSTPLALQPQSGQRIIPPIANRQVFLSFHLSSTPPIHLPSEDLRSAIASHLRRLGWTLDRVKQFIAEQLPGKTLQTLSDDDRVLLLYRLQNSERLF